MLINRMAAYFKAFGVLGYCHFHAGKVNKKINSKQVL